MTQFVVTCGEAHLAPFGTSKNYLWHVQARRGINNYVHQSHPTDDDDTPTVLSAVIMRLFTLAHSHIAHDHKALCYETMMRVVLQHTPTTSEMMM